MDYTVTATLEVDHEGATGTLTVTSKAGEGVIVEKIVTFRNQRPATVAADLSAALLEEAYAHH